MIIGFFFRHVHRIHPYSTILFSLFFFLTVNPPKKCSISLIFLHDIGIEKV